jgi:hypothetical protein
MGSDFLDIWFSGFSESIDKMDPETRSQLLAPCAKACSDSYPAKAFAEAYKKASNMESFLRDIEEKMQGISIEINDDGTVVFVYPQCYCDLHTQGYVDTPKMCDCSRLNLTYNFEAAFGKDCVEVTLLQSVLGGAQTCRLHVRFLAEVTFPG